MNKEFMQEIKQLFEGGIEFDNDNVVINDTGKVQKNIFHLVEISTLGKNTHKRVAQYLIRAVADGMGIYPASINELYKSRGQGKVPFTFTVPAINLRVLTYDAARAVFRAARKIDAAAMIFEIARSEMNYTDQRPAEYSASILGAAIAEGFQGPLFIQGDHFQVSAKKYVTDPETEIGALRTLILEALRAGFFNIDVDTSTLVDLTKTDTLEQQKLNIDISASLVSYIRQNQPGRVEVSIGGEIGEVGGQNSTEQELRAYLDGFSIALKKVDHSLEGLSKISIQTGTSHGGVVLPDGSIASVNVDFGTMLKLSRIARKDYGLGGAVQHGASTLPENAFSKFVEAEACEVHLATNFMNIFFDLISDSFRSEIYAWLDQNYSGERKPGMSDEQFYYKVRKNAVGPFKEKSWRLPMAEKARIGAAWEEQFRKLFTSLGLGGTRKYVEKFVQGSKAPFSLTDYTSETGEAGDTIDLAD